MKITKNNKFNKINNETNAKIIRNCKNYKIVSLINSALRIEAPAAPLTVL